MLPVVTLWTAQAVAADLRMLEVRRDEGRIRVHSELHIEASPRRVFASLADYDNLSSLSSRFKESRSEVASDGTTWVYTLIEGCVWFFCRTVERYARLQTDAPRSITATVDPERSDFAFGVESWQLLPERDGTLVQYTHELEPRFWVPPLIGVWVIRRTLSEDALKAANRIEALALRSAQHAGEQSRE